MDTGAIGSTMAHAIKPLDQVQLLSKARALAAALNNAGKSTAARHKLKVEAMQLGQLVDQLHAAEIVGDHARAISATISARAWEAALQAVAAFENAVQGVPSEIPVTPRPLPVHTGVPANDNQDPSLPIVASDPEREHAATDRDQPGNTTEPQGAPPHVPERDHARDASVALAAVVQLGEAIRAARARSGKSQQDVATLADVGRRYVGEVEAGKPTSEIGKFLAVCSAVGLAIVAIDAQEPGSD